MQRHPADLLSLLLGLLAITLAVAALTDNITLQWLDPTVALSIAALVSVGAVVALGGTWLLRNRRE